MTINYDELNDVLTIEGIRYDAELFRSLGIGGMATGQRFSIYRHADGTFNILKETRRRQEFGRHNVS